MDIWWLSSHSLRIIPFLVCCSSQAYDPGRAAQLLGAYRLQLEWESLPVALNLVSPKGCACQKPGPIDAGESCLGGFMFTQKAETEGE